MRSLTVCGPTALLGLVLMGLGCGPATASDPIFWEPYLGSGGAGTSSMGGGGETSASISSGSGSSSASSTSSGSGGAAPSLGTLSFRFTTLTMDGEFSPKNIGAVWISDAQDVFVKTLEVWAAKRAEHLVVWGSTSGMNVVDAVTGATRKSHGEHVATWNGTGTNGLAVADGAYRVHVEMTEWNSSDSGEPAGTHAVVDFEKSTTPLSTTLPDEAFFVGREITWTP